MKSIFNGVRLKCQQILNVCEGLSRQGRQGSLWLHVKYYDVRQFPEAACWTIDGMMRCRNEDEGWWTGRGWQQYRKHNLYANYYYKQQWPKFIIRDISAFISNTFLLARGMQEGSCWHNETPNSPVVIFYWHSHHFTLQQSLYTEWTSSLIYSCFFGFFANSFNTNIWF